MRSTIKKWGNSAAVRIPAAMMAAAKFNLNEMVEIREKNGRIVIEAIRKNKLSALVAGMRPENIHGEECFGPALGKKAF